MVTTNQQQLAILGGPKAVTAPGPHYVWPRKTQATVDAVMNQVVNGDVSIYNRSGIFAEFEDKFVAYHGGLMPYSLVLNSGTSALWSMYFGAGLMPGDEVIVPAYSFYATYSPLMWTGATPVFCDAQANGNIDPEMIEELITPRTKAVVVTHMWGIPCDMPQIVEICRRHGLLLFEDCSHAHGASIAGQKVGTFGDAAAWSLQGQKIVTGGEGGILLTRDADIFYGALLLGQYNKRCMQQIPKDHPLYGYYLAGAGLKLRAHPWAIAMANEQFTHLDEWIKQKHQYAMMFSEALRDFPFISTPKFQGQPAWYAYVFGYDEGFAQVPIDTFERALKAEGLLEIDRPGSTCPNYGLPLFNSPNEILPHLYDSPLPRQFGFPGADQFFAQAIKLPVWAFADERPIVEEYIGGLEKVCRAVYNNPNSLKGGNNE